MRLYYSGWQATNYERETAVIKASGMQHRCYSFAAVEKLPGIGGYAFNPGTQTAYKASLDNKIGIMMDSGVFSYRSWVRNQRRAGKPTDALSEQDFIHRYVAFCKKYHKLWDFYVTLDMVQICEEIWQRHIQLEKLGIRPVPVFHGDDNATDYLKRYADKGYKLIGLGGLWSLRTGERARRRYLDQCFNLGDKLGLQYHGLAVTSAKMLIAYPFWSIDSSSWSRAAGYGSIIRWDERRQTLYSVYVSDRAISKAAAVHMSKKLTSQITEELKAEGTDYEKLRTDFVARHIYNVQQMNKMVRYAEKRHERSTDQIWHPLF